jgi:RNA polymerase sigma-70 factor (ECF subfamily)
MDPQLIVRAQRGDERAFADLTAAIGGRLDRAAYGILRDRDLAEDAMQAALVQIWRKLPKLRDPSRFDAWAYKLLVHACYAEAKRARRSLPDLLHGDTDGPDALDAVLDRDELERAFRRLSLEQRTVVVLRHYLDLSPDVVAETLGVPVGTVNSRLHRALDAMRASLEADARPVQARRISDGAV